MAKKPDFDFSLIDFDINALSALFNMIAEGIKLEREVLAADPELALAGRRRIEKGLSKIDALGDKILKDVFGIDVPPPPPVRPE